MATSRFYIMGKPLVAFYSTGVIILTVSGGYQSHGVVPL